MPRPDNADLASAARSALGMTARPRIAARETLHAAAGRAVERVAIDGRAVVVKWRDDRPQDREALLYRGLVPAVLAVLGAPRLLGATTVGGTHLLFLEWVDGTPADWGDPAHVRRAFAHLGRLHAVTAGLILTAGLASGVAWRELAGAGDDRTDEPAVLDPGDLHSDNFLLRDGGGVCLLDFENMGVRPRALALRQLRDDASLPQGALADVALAAYWEAAGWPDDPAAFRKRVLPR